jgi:hypothetical protein
MRVGLRSGVGLPPVDDEIGDGASRFRAALDWTTLHPAVRYVAGALAAVIVVAVGTGVNLWFLPFIAGLAAALAARRSRLRILLPVTAAIAVAGWAAPLAWQAAHGQPIMATALVVAALAGVPASGPLVVGVTLLVPALQAMAGTWLARAITGRREPGSGVEAHA